MTTIKTERLLLRNLSESDAADVFAYSREDNVGINAGWEPHESVEQTLEIMNAIFIGQPYVFGIVLPEENKVIGSVGLVNDPKREYDGAFMLGYALGDEYKGRGYMTEAAQKVIEYGFSHSEVDVISAYCYPYNRASQRVIEKCGMLYEGTLQKAELRFDGMLLDNVCYSLSREEYFGGT